MPSNQNNCNNCNCTPNPLDSANWVSESTIAKTVQQPVKGSKSGSGSSSGSSSGSGGVCLIGFSKKEVVVLWTTGTYDAASNLDTNCKSENISWGISGKGSGATMTGSVVTFGKDGAIVTIKVACKGVASSMTLIYLKLQIFLEKDDGKKDDITGQVVPIDVGNYIALSAVVTPASLAPRDGAYAWVIPDIVLKNFEPQKAKKPVTKLPEVDKFKKSLSFHWVSGGDKLVTVATRVKGMGLLKTATFIVDRPSVQFRPDIPNTHEPSIVAPLRGKPLTSWKLVAQLRAIVSQANNIKGALGWCQTINGFSMLRKGDSGNVLYKYPDPANLKVGLDSGFLYSKYPPEFVDAPGVGSPSQTTKNVSYAGSFQLYMMYLHRKPKSRWVPLSVLGWDINMSAIRIGPSGSGHANYQVNPGFVFTVDRVSVETYATPDWEWIVNLK